MTKQRKTIKHIKIAKGQTPLVCLTAYSTPTAKLLDQYCDIILVGDSLGMVLYGMENTLGVSLEMMCNHGAAVVRGSKQAFIVVDMPFGTYQTSKEEAFKNAAQILKQSGCGAVKLEGGVEMAETVEFLTKRGIAVMGHIGLKPQSVHTTGGYRYQGKSIEERKEILEDAIALEEAGAFAIVLEGVTESLAAEITEKINIPTIGIGASAKCDGQILVTDDMLGAFGDNVPKFVKTYADIGKIIDNAVAKYTSEVHNRTFPEQKHCFDVKEISQTKVTKIHQNG